MGESSDPQLTDILALKVSSRLNDKHDIRKLFTFLHIEGHIIEATFKKNLNDTNEIAHELMTEWRNRITGPEVAYTALWEALTNLDVNLPRIAFEVLKEPPTDNISAQPPDGELVPATNVSMQLKLTHVTDSWTSHDHQGFGPECERIRLATESLVMTRQKLNEKFRMIVELLTRLQFDKLTSELEIKPEEQDKITAHHCANDTNVQNARFEILKCWWDKQESGEQAYALMGEALIRAGLKLIAREVLNYPPAMNTSKRSSADHGNGPSSHKRLRTEPTMLVTGC